MSAEHATMNTLEVEHFTDPACPFAFSHEPIRRRLRWHYGGQLAWRTRMIVLTREPGEAELLAGGAPGLQRQYGMPIDPEPLARPASSEPAAKAFVAARVHRAESADRLLRELRVRAMIGGLLDEPDLIGAAAHASGIDPAQLSAWVDDEAVAAALECDASAARRPSPPAKVLDHKLSGPQQKRRYSAPTYVIGGDVIPGFNPVEVYETTIANRAPWVQRRPSPESVGELLDWADAPLATAEVALIMQVDHERAANLLAEAGAERHAHGADAYWARG